MVINVDICVCLSSTKQVHVPDNYEYDPITLEEYVREQIMLPQKILIEHGFEDWIVDEFCVQ